MKGQPNRLGPDSRHLGGRSIDRGKPLQFRLDGHVVSGFAGDTLLSAAMASGIDTVGQRDGSALALSLRHAPAVALAALSRDPRQVLPMERVPATDGADYVTIAPKVRRVPLARLLRRGKRTLQIDLDRSDALAQPWLGMSGEAGPDCDMVVIGGGLAGMSAALAGAKRGQRVVLVESSPQPGGRAGLFGTQEGEDTPDEAIGRLSAAIAQSDAIVVLTSAEVFALRPGVVRLHQVTLRDGVPAGRVVDLAAPRIVVATGALERLPIFPGNRLPGVSGAQEAFAMAQFYGVWPGHSALLATTSSPAYRLAMLATDSGIAVPRIIDGRPQPQSRFIEFSKAYGITLAAGTIVASAISGRGGRGLIVAPQVAMDGLSRAEAPIAVDRLIVCGGWQPDLTLWHMAGGLSAWSASRDRIEAQGGPIGIALAGSAAGWQSSHACLASGSDAVDALLWRDRKPVQDRFIDAIYETPDGAASIGEAPGENASPAFLDGGRRYIERPRRVAPGWPRWLPFASAPARWSLADTPRPLDIADIAAGVQLGAIPKASAGIVAQERVAMVVIDAGTVPPDRASHAQLPLLPAFLVGRFEGAEPWLVAPLEARTLSVGSLIHANVDETDPLRAIGVVVRIIGGTAIALVTGSTGQIASLREPGRAIPIRLAAVYREGMDLVAALGSGAGPA